MSTHANNKLLVQIENVNNPGITVEAATSFTVLHLTTPSKSRTDKKYSPILAYLLHGDETALLTVLFADGQFSVPDVLVYCDGCSCRRRISVSFCARSASMVALRSSMVLVASFADLSLSGVNWAIHEFFVAIALRFQLHRFPLKPQNKSVQLIRASLYNLGGCL